MKNVGIVVSSEDSIQIQFPQKICEEVNAQITVFVENFKAFTSDIPEIIEIVPTYCAVTVYFNPDEMKMDLVLKIAEEVIEKTESTENAGSISNKGGKLVEIPVCYDGEEFAPDLEEVAKFTGLSKEEVIALHSSKDYLIYMLGFLPGFPYLGGMDERLETARLETPRTKIPAGSVAIGGKQTGLYPSDSPGGWRIIGRTPFKAFDPSRNPACLYEAGDKIRFLPVSRKEFEKIAEKESRSLSSDNQTAEKQRFVCTSGIKILEGGMCTTVQDKGRFGYQHLGIGQGGVMDFESFSLGNALLENSENAACLESTVLAPTIQFTSDCEFCITGGECRASLDEKPVPMNQKYPAKAGSILKCGFVTKGLRSYICFKGGILVPESFGSRSTNLKSKTGGYFGRKLENGDELAIGNFIERNGGKDQPLKAKTAFPGGEEILVLECTRGSQFSFFSEDAVKKFQSEVFTVLPESDRMGIRFGGESLNCGKTDIISDSIPFGAVQITSAGLPVVMASDRQTTGGYAKIAAVTRMSMCALSQALPGTKVKFIIGEVE